MLLQAFHTDLDLLSQLGVPVQVFACTMDDHYRKPERGMWDFFVSRFNGGVAPGRAPCAHAVYCWRCCYSVIRCLTRMSLVHGPATDHSKSFFVGDAAGRTADFADTDKGFADNVGIGFRTPEDEFG